MKKAPLTPEEKKLKLLRAKEKRASDMVRNWTRKLRLANTTLKKWMRRQKSAEKTLADFERSITPTPENPASFTVRRSTRAITLED